MAVANTTVPATIGKRPMVNGGHGPRLATGPLPRDCHGALPRCHMRSEQVGVMS